jgi:hypothetical protein
MTMYRVTVSTDDGNWSDDFEKLPEAEAVARQAVADLEKEQDLLFLPYDSEKHLRLYKARKGHVVSVDSVTYGF